MSELKHTPGPWYAYSNSHCWEIRTEKGGLGCQIGDVCASRHRDDNHLHLSIGEAESNARLIAAAPELLEVVEEMVDEFDGYMSGNHCGVHWLTQARAAIAKAAGGRDD